ncbi:MAG: sugar phosphate nucleotidyltransferase [Marivibrio sp.]|uniref:sugar phosphate nucleotidyltransferase n=1 Tax=Marivibrio sp. TaxID=2039719 RepID=UPI0032EBC072
MISKLTDLTPLVCGPDQTVRDALERITQSGVLAQIVVNPDGTLYGTVTDADVRRAILRGIKVEGPVRDCAHVKPIVGLEGQNAENIARLHAIPGLVPFLPIVDAERRLLEVWVRQPATPKMPALIMAGGRGARLGDLTRNTPKPLLDVAGAPILEHVLRQLEKGGSREIFISVHHLSDQVRRFVEERRGAARLSIVEETEPLGTAGAIAKIALEDAEGLIVANGDLVTQTDFHALELFHLRQGNDVTISAASYEVSVPYGVIRHAPDGAFTGMEEKPDLTYMVAAGIYALSPAAAALVPPDRRSDMPELINRAKSIGLRVGVFPIHEYWRDVGQRHDLDAARREHSEEAVRARLPGSSVSEEQQ